MSNDLSEQALSVLLEQISAMIDSKLAAASSDVTYIGVVKERVSATEYNIEYNGASRKVRVRHDLGLSAGDSVHVVYPNGNANKKFLIEDCYI